MKSVPWKDPRNKVFICVLFLLFSGFAHAQAADETALTLKLGTIFFSSMETTFLADANRSSLSTTIDFDQDLDMEDSAGSFLVEGIYRPEPHQRIDFSYYEIDRSGQRRIDREITFDDQTFDIDSVINSDFDYKTLILTYSHLFRSHDELDLGVTAGLHITEAELRLQTDLGNISERAKQTAPLPVVGMLLRYNYTDDWTLNFLTRIFVLNYDNYRGRLHDSKLTVEYHAQPNISFEFGINARGSEIEVKEPELLRKLDDSAAGWIANVIWHL